MNDAPATYTVFAGTRRLARGSLEEILRATKKKLDASPDLAVLIFEDRTGRQVDFDFRGTADEVVARALPPPEPERVGPGRPKLGVVSREISLLPRHWEWLERQPQGASAALRRLVEEASRALFAGDHPAFVKLTKAWPIDVRRHLDELLHEGGAAEPRA